MPELVRSLWSLFDRRERWQLAVLTLALAVRAGVELVGVASIMPFMSVVADPEIVQRNAFLARAYDALGFDSVAGFLTVLGAVMIVVLVLRNAVSALTAYGAIRFARGFQHRLCLRLLTGYLGQPYGFFVKCNSASLNKSLLTEATETINGVLRPVLDIVARLLTIGALIGLLVVVDPLLALCVAAVLGGVYGGIYKLIRKKQRRLGELGVRANRERFQILGEAFGGIKDVKVLQREREFVERFRPASWQFAQASASNSLITQMPRYVIETVAFSGIVLIVLYNLQAQGGAALVLPVVSLYAFAGYRLLPELQALFANIATIRFKHAVLDDLLEHYHVGSAAPTRDAPEPLSFERSIVVEDLGFRYPGASEPALDAVNLRIERNQTVGLVGASGEGKTTLLDLLLGLYAPDRGRILVDGVPLGEHNLRAWRRRVGYVPQQVFLSDDTIAANIAFGVPVREIDDTAVARAAQIANLHEFVMSLPDGYDTVVGERGVRLSGGQRQRIGIARALYHDPDVLVMDEATSALDGVTESAVMEAIRELAGQKTILVTSHSLRAVEDCHLIYTLEKGRIRDRGTYGELAVGSPGFRRMAKLDATAGS
jgi:ATP-binding cassette, subfamily B, bacterial PglK